MQYKSNQPKHLKVCTIATMVRSIKSVCSTEESLTDELNYIKITMRLNGYSKKLITKTIKQALFCNTKSKTSQKTRKHQSFLYHMKKE